MDCDRVFVVLTGAPFPTGTSIDAELERHLEGCDDCRRFAEALRPDEACRHETLPAREQWRLPAYRQAASPVTAQATGWRSTLSAVSFGASYHGSSNRLGQLPFGPPRRQVAGFTVAPPARRRVWWDLASLLALLMMVAAGGWGLGVLIL